MLAASNPTIGGYRILHKIGSGAFGTVYAARDERLGCDVALKVLSRVGPGDVARFKREFRAAASVLHPGLVVLHELGFEGLGGPRREVRDAPGIHDGRWFFTMELLGGVSLAEHLGQRREVLATRSDTFAATALRDFLDSGGSRRMGTEADASTAPTVRADDLGDPSVAVGLARPQATNASRGASPLVLEPMRQVAAAIAFLHEAGVVHCDLKPSNVVVEPSGRAVVVDFGLATLVDEGPGTRGGTPHYMAVEQALGDRAGPPADAYALGAMLFEAIAGRLPFEGDPRAVLAIKRTTRAPDLAVFAPAAPPEIVELVNALLSPDPAARPRAADVARALEAFIDPLAIPAPSVQPPSGLRVTERHEIVGRDGDIARALRATDGSDAVIVVTGPPGIGKTTVCSAIAASLCREGTTLLASRCYERERGPNEVVDGLARSLVDALDARGFGADPSVRAALSSLGALAPSISDLASIAVARALPPRELRALAQGALVDLLGRLASNGRVVIWIEDLHWLDADGLALLSELARHPHRPAFVLLASMRPGASHGESLTAELEGQAPEHAGDRAVRVERIALAPLDDALALRFVRARTPSTLVATEAVRAAVVHAAGNPFLLEQLVDHALRADDTVPSLARVVEARSAELGAEARTLLEILAVAARPVAPGVLVRAARASEPSATMRESREEVRALSALSSARLVRRDIGPGSRDDAVFLCHAALGGAVLELATPGRLCALHLALADALEAASPDMEIEGVARHLLAAGETRRAARSLDVAAARAMAALAFERALELDRLGLDIPAEPADRARVQARRGDAFAALGRGVEAAAALSDAARLVPNQAHVSLELERRAAEQLLLSGRVGAGTRALDRVLARIGMRRPRTRAGALAALGRDLVVARVRGALDASRDGAFGAHSAARHERAARAAARADAAWSLASSLSFIDPLVSAVFTARHAVEAATAGDAERRVRALTAQAILIAGGWTGGQRHPSRAEVLSLLDRADHLAARAGSPGSRARAAGGRGIALALLGSVDEAHAACARAEGIYAGVHDAPWDRTTVQHFLLWMAFERGDLASIVSRAPALFEHACARGDRYAASGLATNYANLAWLLRDGPAAARAVVARCASFWKGERFCLPLYDIAMAEVHLDLWERRPARALATADRAFHELRSALFLHVVAVRVDAGFLRARAAIAAAAAEPSRVLRVIRLARAARDVRYVARAPLPIARPVSALLEASLVLAAGARGEGVRRLRVAARELDSSGLAMLATLARRTAASVGGERAELVAIDGALVAAGAREPDRLAAVFVPGADA